MNKIIVSGRLTKDSEPSYSASGNARLNFSVASDWYMGEKKTLFLNCVMFGKRSESLAKYLSKGQFVVVEGKLDIRKYEGKYYTSCVVDDIELGPKNTPKVNTDQNPVDYDSLPF